MMQKISNRTLTQEEYKALSEKYKVNTDVVEFDPEITKQEFLHTDMIDNLLQENNLAEESREQLKAIKELLEENNSTIDLSQRLTIQNNLVCIDGYTLPT